MTDELTMTEQDEADLNKLLDEGVTPVYHTILEVWKAMLDNADTEITKRITPSWAQRIVASFQDVHFPDMYVFRDRFYGKLQELRDIVVAEISTDDECLKIAKLEEDRELNAYHYRNILMMWQKAFLTWEIDWTPDDEFAGVEIASIAEAHKAIFGDTGLTQFLGSIGFVYDSEDQAEASAELDEYRRLYEAKVEEEAQ